MKIIKTGLNDRSSNIGGVSMVTQDLNDSSIQYLYMNSSDVKPTDGITNGSVIVEVDTGKHFRYDEENHVWYDFGYVSVML